MHNRNIAERQVRYRQNDNRRYLQRLENESG